MSSQSCGFSHSDGLIKVNPYVSRELYKRKKVKQQNAEWYPRGDESARSVDTHREPAPQTRKGRQKELLDAARTADGAAGHRGGIRSCWTRQSGRGNPK